MDKNKIMEDKETWIDGLLDLVEDELEEHKPDKDGAIGCVVDEIVDYVRKLLSKEKKHG